MMLVHIHIPKNAGSTLDDIFKRKYKTRFKEFHTNRRGKFLSDCELRNLIEGIKSKTLYFSGHDIRPLNSSISEDLGIKYITFIRHPLKRARSLYLYEKTRYPNKKDHVCHSSFNNYLIERPKHDNAITNWQTFNITERVDLEEAKKILERFLLVGVVEMFDESLVVLTNKMKIQGYKEVKLFYKKKNASKDTSQVWDLKEKTIEKFMEKNTVDLELYTFAKAKLTSSIREITDFEYQKQEFLKNNNKSLMHAKLLAENTYSKAILRL